MNTITRYKYALCICEKCHGIIFLSADNWNTHLSNRSLLHSQSSRRIIDSTFSKEFISHSESSEWENNKLFIEIKESMKKENFPLCSHCGNLEIQNSRRIESFYQLSVDLYKRLDIPDKQVIINELKEKISLIDCETVVFQEASDSFRSEVRRIHPLKKPQKFNLEIYNPADSESIVASTYTSNRLLPKLSSIMVSVTFHIASYRFFGTINGLKLGQNSQFSISAEEINAALTFLVQMIEYFLEITTLSRPDIAYTSFPIIEKQPLNASDIFTRWGTNKFNSVLLIIFQISHTIFQHPDIITLSAAPYEISTINHTIGGENFFFEYGSPYKWSRPMKLLLFNFKLIQTALINSASKRM